jgi:hypothetical protein
MIYNIVAYFWLKDMSPHLCYPPYSFTGAGGSHNKDNLVYNPATGNLAQKSVISQQARDAKKLKTRMAEEEHAEAAKKAKFDSLVTLEGLSAPEYVEMRKRNMYALPCNSRYLCFFQKEQELIMKEFYASLKKYLVCPQTVIDFSHLPSTMPILRRPCGSHASLASILS